MHLFDKDDIDDTDLEVYVDCMCNTIICMAVITFVWFGSKLVGGSEL